MNNINALLRFGQAQRQTRRQSRFVSNSCAIVTQKFYDTVRSIQRCCVRRSLTTALRSHTAANIQSLSD